MQVEAAMIQETELQAVRVRKWKIFPGNNKFLGDGRCMYGPDWYGFLFCLVVYIVIGALFFGADCRYLVANVSPIIPMVGGILYLYILGTLCTTSLTDPGIIPRDMPVDASITRRLDPQINQMLKEDEADLNKTKATSKYKEVEISGRTFKLYYCKVCNIFRPPRSAHCSQCNNCVERFDHHCPMVGNCIGKRNYRHFYLFLFSVTLFAIYMLGCNITVMVLKSKDTTISDVPKESVATIIEMIVGIPALLIVGGFFCFHSYLIAREMTTYEFLKGTYKTGKCKNKTNPFRHKICCCNCMYVICSSKYPSLLDRRGFIETSTDQNVGEEQKYSRRNEHVV